MKTSKLHVFVIFGLILSLFLSTMVMAANTRVTYPSAFSVEFLGRGPYYSFNFDHVLSEKFSAGFGVSAVSGFLFPVYGNYYFLNEGASPFVTLGMTVSTNLSLSYQPVSVGPAYNFKDFPAILTPGIGYEIRSDQGYLARAVLYGLINNKVSPWVGLSLGYSF